MKQRTAEVVVAEELEARNVGLVVLDQALDTTTPTGRLLFHVLAAIAEFERDLIRDRVKAGLVRAKARGIRLGRPTVAVDIAQLLALRAQGLSVGALARRARCSRSTVRRRLRQGRPPMLSEAGKAGREILQPLPPPPST